MTTGSYATGGARTVRGAVEAPARRETVSQTYEEGTLITLKNGGMVAKFSGVDEGEAPVEFGVQAKEEEVKIREEIVIA